MSRSIFSGVARTDNGILLAADDRYYDLNIEEVLSPKVNEYIRCKVFSYYGDIYYCYKGSIYNSRNEEVKNFLHYISKIAITEHSLADTVTGFTIQGKFRGIYHAENGIAYYRSFADSGKVYRYSRHKKNLIKEVTGLPVCSDGDILVISRKKELYIKASSFRSSISYNVAPRAVYFLKFPILVILTDVMTVIRITHITHKKYGKIFLPKALTYPRIVTMMHLADKVTSPMLSAVFRLLLLYILNSY